MLGLRRRDHYIIALQPTYLVLQDRDGGSCHARPHTAYRFWLIVYNDD